METKKVEKIDGCVTEVIDVPTVATDEMEKGVPGQQLGVYSDAGEEDVKQMVRMLNNPGESSQDARG